jgi:Fe-S oxidoreductase
MGKNELDSLLKSTTLCAYCPKMCRFSCPVSEAESREAVTPWGKMSLLYLGWQGKMPLQEEGSVKALEACTGCGACVEQCAHGNPVAETLFAARGIVETDRSKEMREAFVETGDVRRRALHERSAHLMRDKTAEVAYFPGCTQLTRADDAVKKDLDVLEYGLGTKVPVVDLSPGKWCCGYPLFADGQFDVLVEHLETLLGELSQHELVVTPDPGCAYVLTVVAKEICQTKKWPRVLPLVEVLAEHQEKFREIRSGLRVRYHDPCYLGRRGRSFKPVRQLLATATGRPVIEFAQNCESADCSGGGGLYPLSHPEGAKRMARQRIETDANADQEADVLVTACPSALRSFRSAGLHATDVVDVLNTGIHGKK